MSGDYIPISRGASSQFPLAKEKEGLDYMKIRQNDVNIKSLKKEPIPLYGGKGATKAQIEKSAEEFEAVFISQMLKHMFAGQKPNELMGGGHAEEVYQDMMVDEYGKLIARTGGVGVADHVKRQMLKLQEVGR